MSHGNSMQDRALQLVETYSAENFNVAWQLCDRHEADAVAHTIIREDLSFHTLTYGKLRLESEKLAASFIELGINQGDRIATLMGKGREYLVTLLAIWRIGAVHVPLFTAFAPPAIQFRLSSCGAKLVACDASQRSKLKSIELEDTAVSWRIMTLGEAEGNDFSFENLVAAGAPGTPSVAVGGDGAFIQIYTSGTTGKPKGVVVPVKALAGFHAYAEFALGLRPDDVFWNSADPGWGYGLYFGVLATLTTGTPSIMLCAGFSPELTYKVLSQFDVTNFTAAPTVYRSLIGSGITPPALRLRCASSAGEPLTPEVNVWSKEALGILVHDHFGQTEAGMLVNNHHHPDLKRPLKEGSMGRAMPGWTAVVLRLDRDEPAPEGEVGRLAFDLRDSPFAWFSGYVEEPIKSQEKFAGDGRWYLSGDLARIDSDGYVYFSSRDDDIIIMAGYRIGPFEVESVLATHPAVAESAVIAIPDTVRGEVLEAAVVLRSGQTPSGALAKELQVHVKQNFAAHAYPRRIHFVESLPKTPSGKIQRFVVRQQVREGTLETLNAKEVANAN
ncbi:AMP-binding protein [Agrobacterium tumefaciens]|uniref:AMP-binding protein n=1 Tax=Agrobacterium tumefaciens TaxID=358 RepID=UPI0015731A79|nr:AMP-binding protein [Agrobacterium tumefaciens]NTD87720.1 AMP-binding protein [Agrobacterium tumefaciens]NTD91595.1 AMP-binding protein [Agrobacterium tumefaciens]NTD95581.1 AMP-binding protein [Agrobacterium tumefaciens]NTE11690.1 AMP-binding protein [Agrobacterium tumefaciens]NTE25136.1 AMP-binding protein [Agrobacterium tumefaciens]